MEVLLLAVMGLVNIACFMIGAKVGQTVASGEKVKLPTINPMEIARENQERREAAREQDRVNAILRNIEGYDGTGRGQEDVPGR